MALIKCTECGTPVSTKANACPKCGASLKDKTSRLGCIGKGILILLLLGVTGNLLNFCTGMSSNLPTPSLKQSNESPVEKGSIHDEWKP